MSMWSWNASPASPPPAPPPPPELGGEASTSLALMLAVAAVFGMSALSRTELWQPLPPHYVYFGTEAWRRYTAALRTRPRLTSAISGSLISALGNRIGAGSFGRGTLDFMVWGALVAFLSSLWVPLLGAMFAGRTSRWVVLQKTLVDQLVATPLLAALFPLVHGCLQGAPLAEISRRLYATFPAACLRAWRFWPPVAMVAYSVVPQELTVVFFSLASLAWNVLLTLVH